MFIVKATNKDAVFFDEVADVVYEESYTSFAQAIFKFIARYDSKLWDHIDLIDSETGEVYAYFNATPFELWVSDDTKRFMVGFILDAFLE